LISLGVESTADNLGIGIVSSDKQVLANYIKIHVPKEGGIHPREAARHHSENMGKAIKTALEQAEITMKYEGYVFKEQEMVEKMNRLEEVGISESFDYGKLKSISSEARE
jgi:tRNA U34 5-carboxymethylaminomethyl modifying enzyme MnmG/GidA